MIENQADQAAIDFTWNVLEIYSHLGEIHRSWAELLEVTETQWLILMAIEGMDGGPGVAGVEIARKLRIHPTYVTSQAKNLERSGFLSRRHSPDDARYVLMSLTAKARTEIGKLSKRQRGLNSTMFDEFSGNSLTDLNVSLTKIAKNARLASRLLAIDIS